jgi:hypothetical protein
MGNRKGDREYGWRFFKIKVVSLARGNRERVEEKGVRMSGL